jgi:hypothetical protein
MTTDAIVRHAVIRDADGNLRCMDPGCGFNRRRPSPSSRHEQYHRSSDLGAAPAARGAGVDRRVGEESKSDR